MTNPQFTDNIDLPHVHRASCHDSIGMVVCGESDQYELELAQYAQAADRISQKPRLHWFQWLTYIIVILTCLCVLYGMLETYLFIGRLQEGLQHLGDSFQNLGVPN